MTFAQRQHRLTTHFPERIPVDKRRISVSLAICRLELTRTVAHAHVHSQAVFLCMKISVRLPLFHVAMATVAGMDQWSWTWAVCWTPVKLRAALPALIYCNREKRNFMHIWTHIIPSPATLLGFGSSINYATCSVCETPGSQLYVTLCLRNKVTSQDNGEFETVKS